MDVDPSYKEGFALEPREAPLGLTPVLTLILVAGVWIAFIYENSRDLRPLGGVCW